MKFASEIVAIFVNECKDLLHKVENTLLQIEQGDPSLELVNSVFRVFHNLKGSSAMFELKELTTFLHELESILVPYKNNNLAFPTNKINALLQAIDCLYILLDESVSNQISITTSNNMHNIIAQLKSDLNLDPNVLEKNNPKVSKSIHEVVEQGENNVAESIPNVLEKNNPKVSKSIHEVVEQGENNVAESIPNVLPGSDPIIINVDPKSIATAEVTKVTNVTTMVDQATRSISDKYTEEKLNRLEHGTMFKLDSENFIKVDSQKLDEIINLIGELVIMQSSLSAVVKLSTASIDTVVSKVEKITNLIELLGSMSLQLRMIPVKSILVKFNRMIRDLAIKSNKKIKLYIQGDDTELDKAILEKLNDPLIHLLRNACDHGIDPPSQREALGKPIFGNITIRVSQENNEVVLAILDDGRGIDLTKIKKKALELGIITQDAQLADDELIQFIFKAGFSTADQVTEISGRGFGMDIVKKEVEKLHGRVTVNSKINQGTEITLRLPLTLAIIKGLLIKMDDFLAVIPVWNVVECVEINAEQYQQISANRYTYFRGTLLPGVMLNHLLGIATNVDPKLMIIVNYASYQVGIVVEDLLGEVQAVIKNTPEIFSSITWFNGATILGDGKVAVILDIPRLIATIDNFCIKSKDLI